MSFLLCLSLLKWPPFLTTNFSFYSAFGWIIFYIDQQCLVEWHNSLRRQQFSKKSYHRNSLNLEKRQLPFPYFIGIGIRFKRRKKYPKHIRIWITDRKKQKSRKASISCMNIHRDFFRFHSFTPTVREKKNWKKIRNDNPKYRNENSCGSSPCITL